jgi:hypothetical protein
LSGVATSRSRSTPVTGTLRSTARPKATVLASVLLPSRNTSNLALPVALESSRRPMVASKVSKALPRSYSVAVLEPNWVWAMLWAWGTPLTMNEPRFGDWPSTRSMSDR